MSSDVITSDRVEGTTVYNEAGKKLGSVDHLVIDKQSGQVQYAVLEFGGFLGVGTDRYPIPWNLLKFRTDLDGYVAPITKAQLESAPRYSKTVGTRPAFTSEYGHGVRNYWSRSE